MKNFGERLPLYIRSHLYVAAGPINPSLQAADALDQFAKKEIDS